MGDLNQRISSTGFYWDSLKSDLQRIRIQDGPPQEFKWSTNYRNTREIVAFSSELWRFNNRLARELDARYLPAPPKTCDAETNGVGVQCLVAEDESTVRKFVRQLKGRQRLTSFLYEQLRRSVWVLWPEEVPNDLEAPNVVVKTADHAKGLELDQCVLYFNLRASGHPTTEKLNRLYTLATRPRRRLLLLTPRASFERLKKETDVEVNEVDFAGAMAFLGDANAEIDFGRDAVHIHQALFDGNLRRLPHFDGYESAEKLGVDLSQWERHFVENGVAIQPQFIRESLNELRDCESLSEFDQVRTECLLQRMLGDLDAATQVLESRWTAGLPAYERNELRRIAMSIASSWKERQRNVAALRVEQRFGLTSNCPHAAWLTSTDLRSDGATVAKSLTQRLARRWTKPAVHTPSASNSPNLPPIAHSEK